MLMHVFRIFLARNLYATWSRDFPIRENVLASSPSGTSFPCCSLSLCSDSQLPSFLKVLPWWYWLTLWLYLFIHLILWRISSFTKFAPFLLQFVFLLQCIAMFLFTSFPSKHTMIIPRSLFGLFIYPSNLCHHWSLLSPLLIFTPSHSLTRGARKFIKSFVSIIISLNVIFSVIFSLIFFRFGSN